MTMDVSWQRMSSLSELLALGSDVTELADASKGVGEAAGAVLQVLNAIADKIEPFVQALGDLGLASLVRPLVDDLRGRIRDIRNTGLYVLPIGLRPLLARGPLIEDAAGSIVGFEQFRGLSGGLGGLQSYLSGALLDERDPHRPNFSENAYVAGVGVVAYGLDAHAFDTVRRIFQKLFFSDDVVSSYAQLDRWVKETDPEKVFRDAFDKNRNAGTAVPLGSSPWIFENVDRLIGGKALDTFFTKIDSYLAAILALSLKLNVIEKFITLIKAALQEILDILLVIQEILDFLNLLLTQFPLVVFGFGPEIGGTPGVVASLPDWFDKARHPELSAVTSNSLMVGSLMMIGSPSLEVCEREQEILSRLINFGLTPS